MTMGSRHHNDEDSTMLPTSTPSQPAALIAMLSSMPMMPRDATSACPQARLASHAAFACNVDVHIDTLHIGPVSAASTSSVESPHQPSSQRQLERTTFACPGHLIHVHGS